ncbi:MAG TPA: peptidoglycan DD-metalloendopeptidase family protein [Longimicrobiales bacterium]|nr:peptidoglycan DD-metalloendopeptidase family protein [Longimicrobiales bacterium]
MPSRPTLACLALLGFASLSCRSGPPAPTDPNAPRPATGAVQPGRALPPPLPDTAGIGTHVLAIETAPDGSVWVGTYGKGIRVLEPGASAWRVIEAADGEGSISWDFVNAFAFPDDGSVWYGTVGNGFGVSTDAGRTWRNWGFGDLGPEWQYVAAQGLDAAGDTVYVATADGLRFTSDGGDTWTCVQARGAPPGGADGYDDQCDRRLLELPTEYLLSLDVGPDGTVWLGHLRGVSYSLDGGAAWRTLDGPEGLAGRRVRAVLAEPEAVWVATETHLFQGDPARRVFDVVDHSVFGRGGVPAIRAMRMDRTEGATSFPALATFRGTFEARLDGASFFLRNYGTGNTFALLPWGGGLPTIAGTDRGLTASLGGRPLLGPIDRGRRCTAAGPGDDPPDCGTATERDPAEPLRDWFGRPIADADGNPYVDATYRYGSTMGGNFQQHQGVEFNNPAGTPVRAIGDGVVAFAGEAEAGARTVAVLHDRRWEGRPIYSVYYHNTSLDVRVAERVRGGQIIARVGNTGRATNDHLHLEVHVPEAEDPSFVVNPDERFPPYTVNPQLWIEPLPGTGVIAGRVVGADGEPARGVVIYGVGAAWPEETPLSIVETYGDRAHADPGYGENFAVGDVPEGSYRLYARVDGHDLTASVEVEAGRVTWVEMRY